MIATLTYHSIDDSGSPISVPAKAFEGHLRFFTSGRVRVLPLDELVQEPADALDAIAVTFDDGFANAGPAIDRLLDHGIVPSVFAVTRHAGTTNAWGGRDQAGIPTLPLLSWDQLGALKARGARVEAHTRTHPRLSAASSSRLDEELGGCRDDLETRLGVRPAHFAYPFGDLNAAVAASASRVYPFAHTTHMRALGAARDPARLPRLDMYYFRQPGSLDAWGSAAFGRRLTSIRARRAVKAWLTY